MPSTMKRMIISCAMSGLLQAGLAQISVVGTSTPAGDWDTDYDMVQDAGNPSVYRLNMYLAAGELKFREGYAWTINWGNTNFPSGTAILGGPNIPVTAGFYTITFDTTTLAYSFSSGNVGINNQNPAVSMDIAGALAHRSAHLDVTSMTAVLPANVSLVKMTGSPAGPVMLSGSGGADGQRVVLLNATSTDQQVMAFNATNVIQAGEAREFTYVAGEGWQPLSPGLAANDHFWVQDGANDAIRNINANGFYSAHGSPVTTDPGALPLPQDGAGTRLMWIPEKSAFRAGTVQGAHWNADSIGTWSLAAGFNCIASDQASTAIGWFTKSTGESSLAAGSLSRATGNSAVAIGTQTVSEGQYSFSAGLGARASGGGSASLGVYCTSKGYGSIALGYRTLAKSYASVALGRYNDTIPGSSPEVWIPTDPVLTIGNGSSYTSPSNAVTVLKNGNVGIGNAPSAKAPSARLVVDGYTRLGTTPENAPAIKMKKLTGTGPVTDGTKAIVHGLNAAKILSVSVLMEYGLGPAETIPPKYTTSAGHEYEYQVRANDIFLLNKAGNSANIHQRPIRILITYEE